MKNLIKISLLTSLLINFANAENIKKMFTDGIVSGEIRAIYDAYNYKEFSSTDTYSTAVGGRLKYELAKLNGFNGGVAFTTSEDINFATGNNTKQNDELSSPYGTYTQLSQAYLNYNNNGFNIRAGRQVIDTPLADSDEIKMIQNTFEAYTITYESDNFAFLIANLQRWQGYDAGLDTKWSKTGENGTWLGGITYANDFIDAGIWYYNISKSLNAFYIDTQFHYKIDEEITILSAFQYLYENEIDNSAQEATIYGLVGELTLYDFGINIAYNKSDKKIGKESFSGFGGGTLFTSMDTMILDEIAKDRDAEAIVATFSYSYSDFTFLYAYGNFLGSKNSSQIKEDIVEKDIRIEYSIDEKYLCAISYIQQTDNQNSIKTKNDWDRTQITLNYSF